MDTEGEGLEAESEVPIMRIHFKEEDVGITEYIGTHPGFQGIIKQR